jgi:hypothetical protein
MGILYCYLGREVSEKAGVGGATRSQSVREYNHREPIKRGEFQQVHVTISSAGENIRGRYIRHRDAARGKYG